MADTPRPWAILGALQLRLQEIRIAGGYRTDAGVDVRLEAEQFLAGDADRIVLYAGNTVRPDDARAPGEREFTLIVEAYTSATAAGAQQQIVAMAEDIEQALDRFLPMPDALPLTFRESVFLERPDGVEAMVAQLLFDTRFRR